MDNNRLKPNWNGYQYLLVFFIGFIGDMIVHGFAINKFNGGIGFGESLMTYYNSLKNFWPLYNQETFNIWFWGGIFGGIACMIALLGSDIILQIIDSSIDKYNNDQQLN